MTAEYEDCGHGRHKGPYCHACEAERMLEVDYGITSNPYEDVCVHGLPLDGYCAYCEEEPPKPSGLDASYYDLPENVKCVQDMIEWLNLDFANGNILKSLVRENEKGTTALYEAEKRFYFSKRHLSRVRKMSPDETVGD